MLINELHVTNVYLRVIIFSGVFTGDCNHPITMDRIRKLCMRIMRDNIEIYNNLY